MHRAAALLATVLGPGLGLAALGLPGRAQTPPLPAAPVAAPAPTSAPASAPASPGAAPRTIVQQRLPDGRVIFTDRPLPGATTERRWTPDPTPETEAARAEARRAEARRESAAVSERIGRQLERQQARDAELDQARRQSAQAQAERDAALERARQAEDSPPLIVLPRPIHRPPRHGDGPTVRPTPPSAAPAQPGPRQTPRPGATPPPRPPGAPPEPGLPVYPR